MQKPGILTWLYAMIVTLYCAVLSGDVRQVKNAQNYILLETKERYPQNAFMAVLVGSIMAVVVGSIMLYVGLFASVTVYNAIPTGSLTAADNTTLAGVKTNVNTAFTLLGIVLIVGGAGGIIAVLLGFVR